MPARLHALCNHRIDAGIHRAFRLLDRSGLHENLDPVRMRWGDEWRWITPEQNEDRNTLV